jgi:hypothetical protein
MLTRPRVFTQCRGLATATPAKEVLPLKGIKVLDMTRVLAGVSLFLSPYLFCYVACGLSSGLERCDGGYGLKRVKLGWRRRSRDEREEKISSE